MLHELTKFISTDQRFLSKLLQKRSYHTTPTRPEIDHRDSTDLTIYPEILWHHYFFKGTDFWSKRLPPTKEVVFQLFWDFYFYDRRRGMKVLWRWFSWVFLEIWDDGTKEMVGTIFFLQKRVINCSNFTFQYEWAILQGTNWYKLRGSKMLGDDKFCLRGTWNFFFRKICNN